MFRLVVAYGLVLGCFSVAYSADPPASPEGIAFYENKIRPLFSEHCYSCHSEKASKLKGDLKLDSPTAWKKGGSSGAVIIAGKPDDSPLVQAVRRNHKDVSAMPPEKTLSQDQIALVEEWVKLGAPAPVEVATTVKKESIEQAKARWPFTPLPKVVPIPDVKNKTWASTDIDRFILAKMEAKNLAPVSDADKRSLIRRITYDLTGLPPAPLDVEAFVKDTSPQAYERVVDRLLSSTYYGERWGRHWLDVVRYADTAGDNSDFPIPQMVKYRDWVIDALNKDMPYDQFVKEQLAGDLLGGRNLDEKHARIVATGYIALARRFGSTVDDYPQHLTIEDTLDNVGRTFMGLTINCARCHDHKFDPISMKDYYGLYGIFNGTRYPWPGIELEQRQRDLVALVSEEEAERVKKERDDKYKAFEAELQALDKEKRAEEDKKKHDDIQKLIDAKRKEQKNVVNAPWPFPTAYAVAEGKNREDVNIHLKGDPKKPGEKASRKFLDVLGGQKLPTEDTTSGRMALANWIASAENPLFARVMVNRVWYHHFGKGIVATPNDFGKQGASPTHPELLDYLARVFIEKKFSLKALHREIVLSRVYRLSTMGEVPGADIVDPNNDLLAKYRLRRMDAESLRDTLLTVSGNLDRTRPGPHPFPEATKWTFTQHNPFRAVYDHNHRSVYLMTQRIQRHPFMATFDGADTGASTGSRVTSTTALQSLYLLNDPFVHTQAAALAKNITNSQTEDSARIQTVYELLLARPATESEVKRGVEYLNTAKAKGTETTAWESYVRALFRLNEMVYLN